MCRPTIFPLGLDHFAVGLLFGLRLCHVAWHLALWILFLFLANSYLYRFHLMRRTLFTSVKSASADIVRIVRHSGNVEYDNVQGTVCCLSFLLNPSIISCLNNISSDQSGSTLIVPTTPFLLPNFTYSPNDICPERFKEMSMVDGFDDFSFG